MSTSASPVQPENADEPRDVSEAGVRTEDSATQSENADCPMDVRLSPNDTDVIPGQFWNADEPIVATLPRFTAPPMLAQPENA